MALPPLIPLPAGSSFDGRVLTVAGLDLAANDYELALVDAAGAEITPLASTVGLVLPGAVAPAAVTENTAGFFTPTSAAAIAFFGSAPLTPHQAWEKIAAYAAANPGGSGGTSPVQLPAPTNLRQTASTSSSITVAWDAPANSGDFRLRVNGSTLYMPGSALTYTLSGLSPATDSSIEVQSLAAGNYTQSPYSAAITARTVAAPTANPFRLLTFDDNQTPRLLAGPSPYNFPIEIPLTINVAAGKSIHDAYGFMYNNRLLFASSDYLGNPYETTTTTFYEASNLGTASLTVNPIGSVDFSVAGRLPAGLGGYTSYDHLVISSPSVYLRPGGKIWLEVMVQPNTYNGSNSYGVGVEITDLTFQKISNGVQLRGTTLTYDQGDKAQNRPGSFIDFSKLRLPNGGYVQAFRCFDQYNTLANGMGLRLAYSPYFLGPFDALAADLLTTDFGGRFADINTRLEGIQPYANADDSVGVVTDDYGAAGLQYTTFPAGALLPGSGFDVANLPAFKKINGPNGLKIRHATAVDISAAPLIYPDDNSTTQISYPSAATGKPVLSFYTAYRDQDATNTYFLYLIKSDIPAPAAFVVEVNTPDNGTGARIVVQLNFPQGATEISGSGFCLRTASDYTNTQYLLASDDYKNDVNHTSSTFTAPGTATSPPSQQYRRIEDTDTATLNFVGNWQSAFSSDASGGTIKFLQGAGYVEYAAFKGGNLRLLAPGFGNPVVVYGDVYVDGVKRGTLSYSGYAGEASRVRLQLLGLPAGVLQIRWKAGVGDLHLDCMEADF